MLSSSGVAAASPSQRRARLRDPRRQYLQRLGALPAGAPAPPQPPAPAARVPEAQAPAPPPLKPASPQVPDFVVGTAHAPAGLYFRALEQAAQAKRARQGGRKTRRRGEIRDMSGGSGAVRGVGGFGLLDGGESLASSSYGTHRGASDEDDEEDDDEEGDAASREDTRSDFTGGGRDSDDAELESLTDIFYTSGAFSPPGSPRTRGGSGGGSSSGAAAARAGVAGAAPQHDGGGASGVAVEPLVLGRGRISTLGHIEEEEEGEEDGAHEEEEEEEEEDEDSYGGLGELEAAAPRRAGGL